MSETFGLLNCSFNRKFEDTVYLYGYGGVIKTHLMSLVIVDGLSVGFPPDLGGGGPSNPAQEYSTSSHSDLHSMGLQNKVRFLLWLFRYVSRVWSQASLWLRFTVSWRKAWFRGSVMLHAGSHKKFCTKLLKNSHYHSFTQYSISRVSAHTYKITMKNKRKKKERRYQNMHGMLL